MESFWNSSNLLRIIVKWKWHILSITLLGMLVIGASTYLIDPKFKSTSIVYPINLGTFSDESYSEQMVQILKSRDVTDKIIKDFNLSKHYELDSAYKHFTSTMYYFYGQNVSISKTEYESVEIDVLDTDPVMAANMANAMINYYDQKVRDMHKLKLKELIAINENYVSLLTERKKTIEDRIHILNSDYGILDFKIQVEGLTEGSFGSKSTKANKQLEHFKKYGTEFNSLNSELDSITGHYLHYRSEVNLQKIEYDKNITYSSIISTAYANDSKFSPKRIPITMLGGLSVFALVIFIIAFVEKKKHNI